ncbi:DUF6176 family protein [Halostagnicola sp. A-GB9-2]|uniref:DUF6176 family protein n=1 Tax=Halostagnicola sp. A-GB9-2 TaxID=3048066 RepID=UPI0024C047C3|nr:DUF6176 family protein [Halostagnicola sp. A-GB9-2]MDJ1434168.1 DUF6176 family protein [Halostagnicola sp. A-GB9-2]
MTEATLLKQKVDPKEVDQLKDWMETVRDRSGAALETLQNEGVYTETAFLEETPDGTFLVTYIEAEDLEQVWKTFEESTHEIDTKHKKVMRNCLEDGENAGDFEPLYHLANPNR